MKDLEKLLFTEEHEWLEVVDGNVYMGITQYAAEKLGDVVFVELPETDDEFESGDEIVVIESVKAASEVYTPVDGTIIEVNEELEDEPGIINQKPYEAWLVLMSVNDEDQLSSLMSYQEYQAFIEEL